LKKTAKDAFGEVAGSDGGAEENLKTPAKPRGKKASGESAAKSTGKRKAAAAAAAVVEEALDGDDEEATPSKKLKAGDHKSDDCMEGALYVYTCCPLPSAHGVANTCRSQQFARSKNSAQDSFGDIGGSDGAAEEIPQTPAKPRGKKAGAESATKSTRKRKAAAKVVEEAPEDDEEEEEATRSKKIKAEDHKSEDGQEAL
jgi:hypothetical protein